MTREEIRAAVLDELSAIAPEVDLEALDPAGDVREEIDMDSMDVLNLVIALHQRLDVEIPDADAPKLVTVDGAVAYLANKLDVT